MKREKKVHNMGDVVFLWAKCCHCKSEFGGLAEFDNLGNLQPDCEFAKASDEHENSPTHHGHNQAEVYTSMSGGKNIGKVISSGEGVTYFVGYGKEGKMGN